MESTITCKLCRLNNAMWFVKQLGTTPAWLECPVCGNQMRIVENRIKE
jgi:hypothetical protein